MKFENILDLLAAAEVRKVAPGALPTIPLRLPQNLEEVRATYRFFRGKGKRDA